MKSTLRAALMILAGCLLGLPGGAARAAGQVWDARLPLRAELLRRVEPGERLRIQRLTLVDDVRPLALDLKRMRPAEGLRITVETPEGPRQETLEPRAYYAGTVEGEPGSLAFAVLDAAGELGLVVHRGGRSHVARHLPATARSPGWRSQRVEHDADPARLPRRCHHQAEPIRQHARSPGAQTLRRSLEASLPPAAAPGAPALRAAPGPLRRLDLVIETDHEFYARFGSTVTAGNHVRDLVAYVSALYEAELSVRLNLVDLRLYTSAADPWTARTAPGLLEQLRTRWNSPPFSSVSRHHVHLMALGVADGGLAYINTLADRSYGVGVTTSIDADFNPLSPRMVSDALVFAHELGHAFGADHTHNFDRPDLGSSVGGAIDCCGSDFTGSQCANRNGGAGRYGQLPGLGSLGGGASGGRTGTVMSYCHLTADPGGLGNVAFTFGAGHAFGVNPGRVADVMLASAASFLPLDQRPTQTLAVRRAGTGLGQVQSSPAGIACGADCRQDYDAGTLVSLDALAGNGSRFSGWSGACAGTARCTLTLDQAREVRATFEALRPGSAGAQQVVQRAYMAYYGRPADPAGRAYWADQLDRAGGNLAAIIQAFGNSPEFLDRYGALGDEQLVRQIYVQLLARQPDTPGLNYYLGELRAGRKTLQTITLDVMGGVSAGPDAQAVGHKVDAADHYTAKVIAGCDYAGIEGAAAYLGGVTAEAATLTQAKASLDARCGF